MAVKLILRVDIDTLGWLFKDEKPCARLCGSSQKDLALIAAAEQTYFIFGIRGRYPEAMNVCGRDPALFCVIDKKLSGARLDRSNRFVVTNGERHY